MRWLLLAFLLLPLWASCGAGVATTPSAVSVPSWPPQHAAVEQIDPEEGTVQEESPLTPDRPRYRQVSEHVFVREDEMQGLALLEVVLGNVDPESELPMIVVIHGRGDRPHIPGGPFEMLSQPVRIVMPRAPNIQGAGFSWLPVVAAEGKTELLSRALQQISDRLARLIDDLRRTRRTRGSTIVTGFSQGGMLTVTLVTRHPQSVAIAFPLAGWLPPPLWPQSPAPAHAPPIRAMHTVDDERIAYEPSRLGYEHLQQLGWDCQLESFPSGGHRMTSEMDSHFHDALEFALSAIILGSGSLVPSVTSEPIPSTPALALPAPAETALRQQPQERRRPRARRARRRHRGQRPRESATHGASPQDSTR